MFEFIEDIDIKISLFINNLHCEILDFLMFHITHWYCSCLIYAAVIFAFIAIKKQQCWQDILFLTLAVIFVSIIISVFIKPNVARLRPCNTAELQSMLHIVKKYTASSFSFVSSHAATSFAIAIFVHTCLRKKSISILIFLWAFIYSYSRIYLGVHFFGDVLCGAFLGILCGKIFIKLSLLSVKNKSKNCHCELRNRK
ncbi:MAG: phosphatase PAP2 family protein [Prevotellaceae bacterium]|jgi:undecaprenyl-diphosphatase|nr:phosphatase PAP2 family protein [Prevotellaceae bacterium]